MRAALYAIRVTDANRARLAVTATECHYQAPTLAPSETEFVVCAECVGYRKNANGLRGCRVGDVRILRHIELSASQCCLCGAET